MHLRTSFAALASFAFVIGGCSGSDPEAPLVEDSVDEVNGSCTAAPSCNAAPPPARAASFEHLTTRVTIAGQSPNHRGRDLFLRPTDDAWAIAKFAYGVADKDVKDEEVDVYLQRSCQGAWDRVATARTSSDGEHATVEGVEDTGGRVYVKLGKLPVGRHRVHFVLRGDASRTDAYIEVLAPGQKLFVTDIDGTLTSSEFAEFPALLKGELPKAHTDAAKALTNLAKRGYRPFFLTARPEYLGARTREFLSTNAFPPGIVHTTLTLTGAIGSAAQAYKTKELAELAARGFVPSYAFGNQPSDAEAFTGANIPAKSAFLYQKTDDVYGCKRIESYTEIVSLLGRAPKACR